MKDATPLMGKLVIVRHHESEWNKLGIWTGSRDVHLTDYGRKKSFEMGALIRDIAFDHAFVSTQVRSFETFTEMSKGMEQENIPVERSCAHNERDYGEYTGKNKWEMQKQLGEEVFNCVRRDWDCPVPGGETLKMVYERVMPFYKTTVLPFLKAGKTVLLVSHGNAIRALMKYIENVPDEKVKDIEMLFGSIVIYKLDTEGRRVSKEVRHVKSDVNA